jgi:hypothetical protein
MILTVTFSGLTQRGTIRRLGAIIWNDQKDAPPRPSRNSNALAAVLRDPIRTEDGMVSASSDPKKFMRNLSLVYRSPYMYATEVIRSE